MASKKPTELPLCSPKPALKDRRLITSAEAAGLMGLFKVLANDTRLRLLHALARGAGSCA